LKVVVVVKEETVNQNRIVARIWDKHCFRRKVWK